MLGRPVRTSSLTPPYLIGLGRGPLLGAREQVWECRVQTAGHHADTARGWEASGRRILADKTVQKHADRWPPTFSHHRDGACEAPGRSHLRFAHGVQPLPPTRAGAQSYTVMDACPAASSSAPVEQEAHREPPLRLQDRQFVAGLAGLAEQASGPCPRG